MKKFQVLLSTEILFGTFIVFLSEIDQDIKMTSR